MLQTGEDVAPNGINYDNSDEPNLNTFFSKLCIFHHFEREKKCFKKIHSPILG